MNQPKMSPTAALPGLVAEQARDDAAVDDPAHARHLGQPRAVDHVAGRGAHDRDHLARLDGAGGRRGHVRVDVPDRDRDALRQPGPVGGLRGQRPGPVRRARPTGWSSLSAAKPAKSGLSAARKSARRVMRRPAGCPCSRGAGVARLGAGELPDDPVGGLDPAGRRARRSRGPPPAAAAPWRTPTRRRSCRRSGRATARRARAASWLIRSACGCAAWCFHSFT